MFTMGDGDPGPGGQEGPAGAAGAPASVDGNSGPHRGDTMPEAEAGGVVGASAGLREVALEGGNAEEDSDIGPAEEGEEEEQARGMGHMVDARHFPMTGFRLTFMDLLRSMMNRLYYNNHVIIRPNDPDVSVRRRTRQRLSDHGSATVVGPPEVQVLSDELGEGPVEIAPAQEVEQAEEPQEANDAQEAEEAEEASLWETAAEESEESSLWEVVQEPAAPGETTECQDENSKEEAQGTRSEGKEEKYNKKEEP